MIIQNRDTQEVVIVGESTAKKATINMSNISKLQNRLTKGLYNDGVGACITELSNNMIDSVRMSGKDPIETPSFVEIYTKDYQHFIKFTDTGLGLSRTEFEDIVMNYLTSTKENTNDAIGAHGVGAKSFLALERPAEWTCRKDGIESRYLAYEGGDFLEYDLLSEVSTEKENGVEILIRIKDYSEKNQFIAKAKEKLAYYDEVVLIIDEHIYQNRIHRHKLFQYCDYNSYSNVHFCLKDVVYEINWNQIGYKPIDLPVAIRFELDEGIVPTLSRESVNYNEHTRNLIKTRIAEVAAFFVEEYNKTTEYDSFRSVLDKVDNNSYYVKIGEKEFCINSLEDYSTTKRNPISIKGINNLNLSYTKRYMSELFYGYEVTAYETRDFVWKKDKIYRTKSLTNQVLEIGNEWKKPKIVVVNEVLSGNIKEYLREKNGGNTMYLVNNSLRRKMGFEKQSLSKSTTYYHALDLGKYPREKWREVVKEWRMVIKEMTSDFIEQLNVETTPEYQQWLSDKKQRIKDEKVSGTYVSNYVALNKAKGDITIMTAREFKYGGKLSWDKNTAPIANLHQNKSLTVYFPKGEELPNDLYDYFRYLPKVRFVQLNPSEIKHVKGLHNYIRMDKLKETRPFQRFVTAMLARNLLELEPNNPEIIYEAFPKYQELKTRIEAYEYQNRPSGSVSLTFKAAAIEEARASNLFDPNIYSELMEFQTIIDKFGFMDFLKIAGNTEERRVAKNMMYIMLKNRMVTGKSVEDFELVPKETLVLGTPEQIAAEEQMYQQYEAIAA